MKLQVEIWDIQMQIRPLYVIWWVNKMKTHWFPAPWCDLENPPKRHIKIYEREELFSTVERRKNERKENFHMKFTNSWRQTLIEI